MIIILSFFQKVNYLLEIYKYFRICMIFFYFSIESYIMVSDNRKTRRLYERLYEDFIITTDTTTDLPASYVNEHHLGMMSLPYTIENQTYTWEHSLPEKEFYAMMRNGSLPTTSQANPEEAENLFENIIKTRHPAHCIFFRSEWYL